MLVEATDRDPEGRAALLAWLRADDAELARELEERLARGVHGATVTLSGTGLAGPPVGPPMVDRYRILSEIGRGGMGRVFLAERSDGAYRQQVAIKVLAGGLPGREEVQRRFVAERQILARLVHPSIARLLDGGSTRTGEPFLVMEHVQGRPIDDWCRQRSLPVEEIVRLVLRVCDAVDYAHRNLVVHRDLKPTNILVTEQGDPKLLDFGIAKLLDPAFAAEAAVETRTGYTPLTPRYASPEQVRGEPITTATDVYSVGVVLFELLTGESPYRSSPSTPLALVRAVCDEEPAAPSAAVSPSSLATQVAVATPGGAAAETAEALARRRRLLRGDLDAILLKALRKETAERYGTVAELAADLRAHLEGRPVGARRGSRLYRVGKFARRHVAALAAAGLFVALVAGFAIDRQLQLERTARERDKARRVTEFLVDLFEQSDPSEARGSTVTVREALDRGAAKIERQLGGQPDVEATLLEAVGRVYQNLGLYRPASELLGRTLALRRASGSPTELARALLFASRAARVGGDLEGADRELDEALGLARSAGDSELLRQVLTDRGILAHDRGDYARAESNLVEAYDLNRRAGPDAALDLAENRIQLALIHQKNGDVKGSRALILEAEEHLARGESLDPVTAATVRVEASLAWRTLGEPRRAAALLDRAIADFRRLLPGDHAELANAINTQGIVANDLGDLAGCERAFAEALAMWTRLMGEKHPRTSLAMTNLGVLCMRRGDWHRAEELLTRGSELAAASQGKEHPDVLIADENLADVELELGAWDRAGALLDRSEAVLTKRYQAPHPALARLWARRARHLDRRGEPALAEPLARRAVEGYRATSGPGVPAFVLALVSHARVLLDLGRPAEARPLLEEARRGRVAALGEKHYEIASIDSLRGAALLALGEPAKAAALLEGALAVQRAALLPSHPALAETRLWLARALLARGERNRSEALLAEAATDLHAAFPGGHPVRARVERELAAVRGLALAVR